ncbi:ABC transporter substrate-binding protein [Aestuariimicrobium ganziense]|uniref:ABC transporter substrate-binding protein n=1 Tax=Aestuariimicrobium ganziense TaxID=2773677 RepID=UPI001943923C|nr:ABC transporter substrate-binding protein [Aestuariimicrobium ganziense]
MFTSPLSRRSLFLASAAVTGAAALAGCSFDKGESPQTTTNGSGSASSGGKTYTIDTYNLNVFGPRPSFVNNFSPASPAEGVVGTGFLYEAMLWSDRINGNELKPWLASEFSFDRPASKVTMKLRDDATWSDGKPITADDVVYTVMEMPEQAEQQKAKGETFDYTAKKVDDLTIEFTWPNDKTPIEGDRVVGNLRPKPKHIFSEQNLATFTNNSNPVTSTPLTLERFTPQQVTFAVRDDHFIGEIPHVKKVNWVTYGSEDVARNLLLQGKMDLATISLQNPQATFESRGEGNKYWTVYANNAESIIFNTARAPFNDRAVRKAIYAAIDSDKLHALFDIGLPSISPTGLDPAVWGDQVKSDLTEPHKPDIEAAKKLLADAGWTISGGNLTKDGKSHPLTYKVVANYTNWATWSDGIKAQLKEALGLDIKVLKIPEEQLFDQVDKGEYDFSMSWAASGTHMAQVYAGMHSKGIAPMGEAGANTGRIKDPELDKLLDAAAAELDEAKLKDIGHQLQQRVVDECYIGPVNPGASFIEVSGANWTGYADKLEGDVAVPLMYGTADTWRTLQTVVPKR